MSELSILELDAQHSELLPSRETLAINILSPGSFDVIIAHNTATAVQAVTAFSHNNATASQTILVGNVG
jgi:hypothetical protein